MESKESASTGITNDTTNKLFKAVVGTAKATQFLIPTEYAFFKSSDKNFSKSIKRTNKTLLEICNKCINYVNNTKGKAFTDINDFSDNYKDIVEVMDNLLEKAVGLYIYIYHYYKKYSNNIERIFRLQLQIDLKFLKLDK